MGLRKKPKKIIGIRVSGRIIESSKKHFKFKTPLKDKRTKDVLEYRVQEVKESNYNYFKEPMENSNISAIYLTKESMKGLYKDSEKNIPYEVIDIRGSTIYRQSIIEKKEEIYSKLEKAAIEEGLRKTD